MARRGKIARLPRDIREKLNRRLQDGRPGNKLVTWLNSLQKVKDVLRTEFNGQPINAQNLSDWKDGGYRDWLIQQETVDLVRLMHADSAELTQAANDTRLSDLLSQRLVAHIVLLAQRLDQSTADGPPDPKLLRELCADIVALRKGDHSAERLKLARERLDFDRESDSRDLDKLLPKWAKEHGYEPRPELTPEEWADRMRQIFEVDERHDTRPQVKQPAEPSSPDQSNLIKPDQTNNSTAAT